MSALNQQIDGDHYRKLKIQPMEYSLANGLNACQHQAIQYITRYQDKGGITDLRKAIHTLEILIEFEQKGQAACHPAESDPTGFVDVPGVRADTGCEVPPGGWACTRRRGHGGPCAAYPTTVGFTCVSPCGKPTSNHSFPPI